MNNRNNEILKEFNIGPIAARNHCGQAVKMASQSLGQPVRTISPSPRQYT